MEFDVPLFVRSALIKHPEKVPTMSRDENIARV